MSMLSSLLSARITGFDQRGFGKTAFERPPDEFQAAKRSKPGVTNTAQQQKDIEFFVRREAATAPGGLCWLYGHSMVSPTSFWRLVRLSLKLDFNDREEVWSYRCLATPLRPTPRSRRSLLVSLLALPSSTRPIRLPRLQYVASFYARRSVLS